MMLATPNNMRRCEAAGLRVLAVDPDTFETYSATSGDYWMTPGDEALTGELGSPCFLAVKVTEYREITESDVAR